MSDARAPIIEATGLSKSFTVAQKDPGRAGAVRHFFRRRTKEIRAVTDVSFTIRHGEVVGFLGANGAGKTTTLKMLTGLLHPTAGGCSVGGWEPFRRTRDFLQSITLVMGNKQQLMWDLPTLDTLKLNAAIYGVSDADYRARVDELAGMLELADKLTQPVRKLSLGERMKAELLAALLHAPRVLFLDEPTLGLDVNAQVAVRGFLKRYNEKTGATILMTSHYMADITALCQRVLVIHEGALVHDGGLDELLRRFGARRELKIELAHHVDRAALQSLGEVLRVEGSVARIAVEPSQLVAVVGRALAELPVIDLTVHDPPIEEVVGRVIGKGQRANHEGAGA